ncbi:MAG TPA: GNAT family N-acetyltransferase [Gemmatimonadales bacterium]|nr:GNAT family N-acetyltransferase [Gemmatimonadales bacterium]
METSRATRLRVVPFSAELAPHFSRLNREWIERLFAIEAADRMLLDDPKGSIVDQGGMIYFALEGDEVLGTCAAMRLDADRFELAKMGVTPAAQGKGIGRRLGLAAIEFARQAGAKEIVLHTSSRLAPALHLYDQLGFVEQPMPPGGDYVRSDVYMVRPLND